LCLYDGTDVEENVDYLLSIHLLLLLLLGQVLCVCVNLVSHIPAGPLRLGVGLPKQLMALLRVRAPGLTSSAAPVWTGVRSCGLNTIHRQLSGPHSWPKCHAKDKSLSLLGSEPLSPNQQPSPYAD
jgi:hypothetical protein